MKHHRTLLPLFAAAALFIGAGTAMAENTEPAGTDGANPPAHTKNLWEQIEEGGWVMIPIGACSILTLYLIGDGIIRTSAKRALPTRHVEAVKNFFRQGQYVGAYDYCKANRSPFTNVCRVAVSMIGEGKAAVEEGTVAELSKEDAAMQNYISYLSVIGVCTPMIGLLGTVTGMIKAFATLGSAGIGDPSSLSAAIGEVLVATASGLFIAIPAFGAYYFLRNRAGKAMHDIQDTLAFCFRKMPYADFIGVHIGDEELVAARPEWVTKAEAEEETVTA